MYVSKGNMAFVVYKYLSAADKSEQFIVKGAGGMKLASDFKLPLFWFSSNQFIFFPIRVGMWYSGSYMKQIR